MITGSLFGGLRLRQRHCTSISSTSTDSNISKTNSSMRNNIANINVTSIIVIVNASARPPRLAGLPTVGTCNYRYTGI